MELSAVEELSVAAYGGNVGAVQRLLAGGASAAALDATGLTALHRAAIAGQAAVVALLPLQERSLCFATTATVVRWRGGAATSRLRAAHQPAARRARQSAARGRAPSPHRACAAPS